MVQSYLSAGLFCVLGPSGEQGRYRPWPSWEGQTIDYRKLKQGEAADSMEQGRHGSCSLGRFIFLLDK